MADDSMALLETLRKATADADVDLLREGVRVLAQAIMEAEVSELTGVPKGERDPERRLTSRNGYRDRRWDTRVGSVELAIPRVRDGSYFPSLLEPRRRAERGRSAQQSAIDPTKAALHGDHHERQRDEGDRHDHTDGAERQREAEPAVQPLAGHTSPAEH